MTQRIFSKLLKPLVMVGTVFSAGVVLSMPAMAQAESQVETTQEIELSTDALEILCERSPLNSRCEGGAAESRNTINNRTERIRPDETDPADAASDPAEAPVDDAPGVMSDPSDGMQPGADAMPMPDSDGGTVSPKQTSETQTAPSSTTPAAEPSGEPSEATSTPDASVSEAELEKFAEAVPQLQAIERSTQQEVVQAIEESGISRERFGQLYQQQTSGSAIEPAPTAEEQETFTQAYSSIQKIQQDALSEREQIIQAQGLEPQRFDQILAAVLQDPALQQQVQNMMAQ